MKKFKLPQEHFIYFLIIICMNLGYLYASFLTEKFYFGFCQIRRFGLQNYSDIVISGLFFAVCIAFFATKFKEWPHKLAALLKPYRSLLYFACAFISFFLFYHYNSVFYNPDGIWYSYTFEKIVPLKTAFVKHDEMLELFCHSKLWYYTSLYLNWTVQQTYRFLSALAGAFFIPLLLIFSFKFVSKASYSFFALILTNGFMQLFFGDMENYTLLTLVFFCYLFAGVNVIKSKMSLVIATSLFTLSACFHMLTGWFLPSLLFLFWLTARRYKYRELLWSGITSFMIFGGTLLFFHIYYLPISHLFYYSYSGKLLSNLASPSLGHYIQVTQLLFLLFPSVLILIPLLIYRRIPLSKLNIFLLLNTVMAFVFLFFWNAALGHFYDWNLFAPGILPVALLCWINFLNIPDLKYKPAIIFSFILTSGLHSYCWIIGNHFPHFLSGF